MNFAAVALIVSLMLAAAAETPANVSGRVLFGTQPVPGATVTAARGARTLTTMTDGDGVFQLTASEDGVWRVRVEMRGFVPLSQDVTVPVDAPITVTLVMQPYDEIVGHPAGPATVIAPAPPGTTVAAAAPRSDDEPDVINGSAINGASTPYAQPRSFGNNRPQPRAPYSGGVTGQFGSSALNASPYVFSGRPIVSPSYGDGAVGFSLSGPLKLPWLIANGPAMTLSYQHGLSHTATTQSALVPTDAQRAGDFSGGSVIRDPATGLPFDRNVIPADRISPIARALLAFYPTAAGSTSAGANFERPLVSSTTRDALQFSTTKTLSLRTSVGGSVSWQRSVSDAANLFDFTDTTGQMSLTTMLTGTRRLNPRRQVRGTYQFSRVTNSVIPYFAGRANVSGDAGLTGNDQSPDNWGPPTLLFPDVAGLSDGVYQRAARTTHTGTVEMLDRRGAHNLTYGGDARWNGLDVRSEQDPRGTLSFTGAATGNAFADFLLGLPTTSAIATGNPRARLHGGSYDAYFTDDWRSSAGLTLNLGLRWEYEAPYAEASDGLANLDVAPGYTAIAPVLASNPIGPITGAHLPSTLLRTDGGTIEPRLAASWRPLLTSSLVIRGSYALYRNLGLYQPLAVLLSQQPPIARTFSVQASPSQPLTLASPFPQSLPTVTNTFGVDPNFRAGLVQSWNLTVQDDLPASLTVIAAYFGDRGSRLPQAFLPNTYPAGADNPCPSCPSGFVFVTSTGRSTRDAAQFTLRRRLHGGLMASVQYTLAKATDDTATFSNAAISPSSLAIAQDWRDLGAERGPSSFDQRHLVSAQFQYTTGVGVGGGTLVDSVWGRLFKDWTVTAQLNAGSGLPVTPIAFRAVAGTGVVGIRPDVTGVPATPAPTGSYVNPDAFTLPASGAWGNAGRNSLRGPATFGLDMTVARVFRLTSRLTLEWRVLATNVLNRVTFAQIGTIVGSPQFGLPTVANPMRRIQTSFRFSF